MTMVREAAEIMDIRPQNIRGLGLGFPNTETRTAQDVVYPKEYIDCLNHEVKKLKNNIASGRQPVFNSIDALFEALDNG